MGFNSAFKGLTINCLSVVLLIVAKIKLDVCQAQAYFPRNMLFLEALEQVNNSHVVCCHKVTEVEVTLITSFLQMAFVFFILVT